MAPAKPERGSHSSGTTLARRLVQPTRMTGPETGWGACAPRVIPIRSCSRWGLPCRRCRQRRGGLLPHPFTLTRMKRAVCFLWHFPWGRPRRTLSGTVFPWSPDFPPPTAFRHWWSAAARPTGMGSLTESRCDCHRKYGACARVTRRAASVPRRNPPARDRPRATTPSRGGRVRPSTWPRRNCRRSRPRCAARR